MQTIDKHPGLPAATTYEQEYDYWPWGELINYVQSWLLNNAPANSYILDYMCGTGFLLNQLGNLRTDVSLYGCSITKEFIEFAQVNYKNINVQLKDVFEYNPAKKPNIIIATGGIHHLDYSLQEKFIYKVASELPKDGLFIIGEEIISPYRTPEERKLSILEISNALIKFIIGKKAPENVIRAAIDLQSIDMFEKGEYKLTLEMLNKIVSPYFSISETKKIWPNNSKQFGDYVLICKKK